MFREKVISTKVLIPDKSHMVYFPIRLPDHAVKIIGVEYGIRMLGSMPTITPAEDFASTFAALPAQTLGHLRLEHPGCSGLFYATVVTEPDSMVGFADFSARPGLPPMGYSHAFNRLEDAVDIPKQSRLVRGIYEKTINKKHHLLVHVWVLVQKGGNK